MSYKLRFHEQAWKEWQRLDTTIREPLRRKLLERLQQPRIAQAALHGTPNCYKIKLQSLGYRLIYRVDEAELFVTALAIGQRDKDRVYQTALHRLQEPTPPYP